MSKLIDVISYSSAPIIADADRCMTSSYAAKQEHSDQYPRAKNFIFPRPSSLVVLSDPDNRSVS